jgi:hypothetical protein
MTFSVPDFTMERTIRILRWQQIAELHADPSRNQTFGNTCVRMIRKKTQMPTIDKGEAMTRETSKEGICFAFSLRGPMG